MIGGTFAYWSKRMIGYSPLLRSIGRRLIGHPRKTPSVLPASQHGECQALEFKLISTEVLYQNTLLHSAEFLPWAFEDGRYVPLELKSSFVEACLDDPDRFVYQDTEYWEFLKASVDKRFSELYDGNSIWALADPDGACRRFESQIHLIVEYADLYNSLREENVRYALEKMFPVIVEFERSHPVVIEYLSSGRRDLSKEHKRYLDLDVSFEKIFQCESTGGLLPNAAWLNGRLILTNGTHRSAIFRSLTRRKVMRPVMGVAMGKLHYRKNWFQRR